jgi:hypothetical protein
VAVDDVRHFEASEAYFANALQLVVEIIAIDLRPDVREDAVSRALAYVEGLSVSRID